MFEQKVFTKRSCGLKLSHLSYSARVIQNAKFVLRNCHANLLWFDYLFQYTLV